MDLNVFVEIRTLGEAEGATRDWAGVGSLVGVDAQVVEEVVPLPEVLAALFVVAFEDLDIALALGVLEGKDPELLRRRHVLFNLH